MELKKISALVGLICWTFLGWGQIQFNRVYNGNGYDEGQGLIQLADSGFIVVGTSSSFENAPAQAFLMRLNKQGYHIWSIAYGGSESEMGRRVIERTNVGYYLFGTSNSGPSASFDFWVVHTDLAGNVQWEKRFDNGGWERLNDAVMLSDTSFVLVGETDNNVEGLSDRYMLCMDKDGNVVWQNQTGVPGEDVWRAVTIESANSILAVGSSYVTDSLMAKGYIASYQTDGTLIWDTIVGKHGAYLMNEVHLNAGTWVVTGQSYLSDINDYNGFILRLSTSLQFVSTDDAIVTSNQERLDQFEQFTVGGSQNYCVASQKYDPVYSFSGGEDCQVSIYTPVMIWGGYGVNYGTTGQDAINEMIKTNDGYIAFVGYHYDQNVGGASCFVVKLGGEFTYPSGAIPTPLSILTLEENVQDNLIIYPNPMQSVLFLEGNDVQINAVVLYNAAGQEVIQEGAVASIAVENLPAGIYLLEVTTSKGKAYRKLIK